MKNLPVNKLFLHPAFQAAILSILGFLLLNVSPARYIFEVLRNESQPKAPVNYSVYYADLNSDGKSERFSFHNEAGYCYVVVLLPNAFPKDQWNFRGSINTEFQGSFTGDYDHDGFREIACFSLDAGEILLNVIEPFTELSHIIHNQVIDTLVLTNPDVPVYIGDCKFHDLNGDHFDEVVFTLTAAPERQPRGIYALDIRNRRVLKSPLAGSFIRDLLFVDTDHDNHPEIFGYTKASFNYPDGGIFLPDTCAWMIRFDEKLQIPSPPVPVGKPFSRLWPYVSGQGADRTVQFYHSGMEKDTLVGEFYELTHDFSLKKIENPLNQPVIANIVVRSADETSLIFPLADDEGVIQFNGSVWNRWKGNFPYRDWILIKNSSFGPPDIQYAYLMADQKNSIMFLNGDGKKMGILKLDVVSRWYPLSWIGQINGAYRFVLSDQEYHYTIEARINTWYNLRYLLLLGLFAGLYAFILLIRFIQARQIAQKEATRKEILQWQLKSVRNHLDPHFTFNALNALSSLSLEGNHQGVDRFIGHFSRLLRSHLNTADQVLVPLREEIEFVVNYAELQRIRFDSFFSFEVDVDPDTDLNRKIPKMLIQTHVENAIKHGLQPCRETGKAAAGANRVRVNIRETESEMIITIEDNGCGRGHSHVRPDESTGTGLNSLSRIISSVRELYNLEISQQFEDLHTADGSPAGTRVSIRIRP